MSEFYDPYAARVQEFHRALYGTDEPVGEVDAATALCRVRLMTEELAELIVAIHARDFVKIADGLADLLYVVHGTAIVYGVPVNRVFEAVHTSNLSKDFPAGATTGQKAAVKGARYRPPDLGFLAEASTAGK